MINVLIADDHPLVRSGIRQLLLEDGQVGEIGEAASGQQTMDKLRGARWDLLILDISMPDRSGVDILKHVRSGFPATRVLVVSGFPESQYAVNMLRAGASGFVPKDSPPADLLKAMHTVIAGRRYISAALADSLVKELDSSTDRPLHSQLSEREFQIFCKLAGGKAVSEIAAELCLSVKTISTYRSRVLEKMNFRSNAEITTYALRNGLIQ